MSSLSPINSITSSSSLESFFLPGLLLFVLSKVLGQLMFQIISYFKEEATTIGNSSYWEEPEEYVLAQDALEVAVDTKVVWTFELELIIASFFLTEFNGCVLVLDEPQVEAEESSDDEAEHACQNIGSDDEIGKS